MRPRPASTLSSARLATRRPGLLLGAADSLQTLFINAGYSMRRLLFALLGVLVLSAPALAQLSGSPVQIRDPENTLFMDLKYGRVVIALRPDLAPHHVARIKQLVRQHFYDGMVFHRVIDGFMAQTGDPTGTGRGGSGQKIKAEFSPEPYVRGTVGMARAADPDSGDSQFFIMFERTPSLDGKYTVWGRVISGMEYIDKIKRGEPPSDPDRILKMQVAADVPGTGNLK
jgi:peptidylprolyl isomerase